MNTENWSISTLPEELSLLKDRLLIDGERIRKEDVKRAGEDGRRQGITWGIIIGAAISWGTYLLGWVLTRWVLS